MIKELLIIIDPQNDFTHSQGFYGQNHPIIQISGVKNKINALLTSWDKSKVVVIYSDYQFGQFEKNLGIGIPETFGHKFDNDFHFDNELTYMPKTQHSAFTSEIFTDFLKATSTERIFVCGFLAEYCVKQTTLDALNSNYKVCLIEDCIGTGDDVQDRKMEMILTLKDKGAEIIDSTELTEQIKS